MLTATNLRLAVCGAASLLAVAAAQAADLPTRVVAPVAPVVIPVASWTGFYIGGSVGGDFTTSSHTTTAVATGFDFNGATSNVPLSQSNFRLGGYVGYNYQIDQFVIGVEGDGAYDFSKSRRVTGIPGEVYFGSNAGDSFSSRSSRYDASARGRAGFLLFPNALVYATGGAAFRDYSYTAICAGRGPSFCSQPESQTFSGTRTGWTVGGGVEGMITPHLIARIEYRYSDFGSQNLNYFGTPNGASGDYFGARTHLTASTVMGGLAYKFNFLQPVAPVVARY